MTEKKKPFTFDDGTELTKEYAEKVADEAEAGYDLRKARRRGRPSLSGDDGRSPQIVFRTSPEVRAATEKLAEREGKTISDIAREALETYVGKA